MSNLKVLLVDDNEQLRECMEHALLRDHADVTAVCDGQAAVDCLRREEAEPFDVVLSDVDMPRLDGWGLLAWVRTHEAQLPVVLMSAGQTEGFVHAAKAGGARGALRKPFGLRSLYELLASVIGSPGERAA